MILRTEATHTHSLPSTISLSLHPLLIYVLNTNNYDYLIGDKTGRLLMWVVAGILKRGKNHTWSTLHRSYVGGREGG